MLKSCRNLFQKLFFVSEKFMIRPETISGRSFWFGGWQEHHQRWRQCRSHPCLIGAECVLDEQHCIPTLAVCSKRNELAKWCLHNGCSSPSQSFFSWRCGMQRAMSRTTISHCQSDRGSTRSRRCSGWTRVARSVWTLKRSRSDGQGSLHPRG